MFVMYIGLIIGVIFTMVMIASLYAMWIAIIEEDDENGEHKEKD